ncbi:MAG: hypothetical protein AAF672_10240 [Pseudomonadota bacterium]
MIDARGPYRGGALFVGVSGLLHFVAPLVAGFAADTLFLIPVGALYLLIAYVLLRGWRLMAYVAFLLMMLGSCFAIASIWTPPAAFGWAMAGIAVADWLAAVALFVALWRNKSVVAEA